MLSLGALVSSCPGIDEVDLNPVIVRPDGYTIVDARMSIAAEGTARPLRGLSA